MLGSKIKKANQIARKAFIKIEKCLPEKPSNWFKRYGGQTEAYLGSLRKTRKFCSSTGCCGNPRKDKWRTKPEQLTRQERRAPKIENF